MKNKKTALVAAVIFLCVLLASVFSACGDKDKKAIIILPGILASGLYDTQTGNPVWDPFQADLNYVDIMNHQGILNISADVMQEVVNELFPIIEDIVLQNDDSVLKLIAVDEDGVPKNNRVAPTTMDFDNPSRLRYGVLNCCTEMYEELEARYGSKADVVVFNYDWRLDNRVNAEKLENFINENGYDEVTLMAHSMGGDVSNLYLARSAENREKVKCMVTYDTPYFGALMALEFVENLTGMVDQVLDIVSTTPVISDYLDSFYEGCQKGYGVTQLRNILMQDLLPLMDITSLYQLLPSYELLSSPHYYGSWDWEDFDRQTGFIEINGSYITAKDDLLNFYESRDWAKKEDGTLKASVAGLSDYWDSMYVDVNGEKVFASSLVNTQYFVGINYKTSAVAVYNAPLDGNGDPIIKDAAFYPCEVSALGDGTVLAYSSTANNSLIAPNVHLMENADHADVAIPFKSTVAEETYSFLDQIIFGK